MGDVMAMRCRCVLVMLRCCAISCRDVSSAVCYCCAGWAEPWSAPIWSHLISGPLRARQVHRLRRLGQGFRNLRAQGCRSRCTRALVLRWSCILTNKVNNTRHKSIQIVTNMKNINIYICVLYVIFSFYAWSQQTFICAARSVGSVSCWLR